MAVITAEDVKRLRQRTGLPMMDCKSALAEASGDHEKAIELLRRRGKTVMDNRMDRETAFGRFGLYFGMDRDAGAIVELKCESAPVAGSEQFIQLASDLAQQLATGPGASSADELLDQPSPSNPGTTLRDQRDELMNQIREVFNIGRMRRVSGPSGGYSHNAGTISGVLVSVEGKGTDQAAKDIAMHIAAMRPQVLSVSDLDDSQVQKEREILREAALKEGKPESIVDKMVEGRLKNYYGEKVLLEQPFVKDDSMTVGQFAKSQGMTLKGFIHWELGVQND